VEVNPTGDNMVVMRDGPIRAGVKMVALVRFAIDIGVTRIIRRLTGSRSFVLKGSCRRCGGCCETPMIQTGPALYYLPTLRWLFLTWHRLVNRFELVRIDRASRTFTFRCTHWDHETRLCDSYATRPGMCRDYPRPLLDTYNPKLLDTCGWRAVDRRAERLKQGLAKVDLPQSRLLELEKRLHLLD
jgi:Fe-S-cluster containining protein